MQVWLKLLIVWCTALALPVQGVAGAVMAHCGPGHERMAAQLEHRHAHPTSLDSRETHAHDHAGAAAPAGLTETTASPQDTRMGDSHDLAQFKCSACASCCTGVALLSVMPQVPAQASASAVFAELMVAIDAVAADGPDRPPRS